MTLTSDPPLPQNRTLCCSDRHASPPMYTTSLLVLQKQEPIRTYAKPMALIAPFVLSCCMQMGSTRPHYILQPMPELLNSNFKIQISMAERTILSVLPPEVIGTILHGLSFAGTNEERGHHSTWPPSRCSRIASIEGNGYRQFGELE